MSKSNFTIRFLTIAEDDFSEIISFIAADNIKSAKNLADKIEKNLELISQNPQLGKVPGDPDIKKLEYCYLVIENYLIFYKVENKTFFIHRILHSARDYKTLLL